MSPRRAQLPYLAAIADLTADGLPTTFRSVAARLGVQPSAVHQMAVRLRRDGWLTFASGASRTLRLTPAGSDAVRFEVDACTVAATLAGEVNT